MEPVYLLAKGILKPWLRTWFRWHMEGIDRIPSTGPAILAFNHIAYLDPFAAAYAVDAAGRRPRFLAKSELFADRRIAWILKGCGQIGVGRGTRAAPVALDNALDGLRRGEIVVVFPEGTITTDPDLNPMAAKSGTARMALESQVPVLPCAIWGTQNVWAKGYAKHWWPPRQDILVRVGEPYVARGSATDRADIVRVGEEIMDRISLLLASLRPALPDRRRPKKSRVA
jgi:1-acyl-sn-glycerol-3-phosphate acyltransferase